VPIFDDDVNEEEYLDRVIPDEGVELWQHSIDASPNWDDLSPEQHMEAADLFAEAIYSGSIYTAEDFTDFIGIEWDDSDIADFWDLYETVSG